MASIIPSNGEARVETPASAVTPPEDAVLDLVAQPVLAVRGIVDEVRRVRDVPNKLKAPQEAVRDELLADLKARLPKDDAELQPLTRKTAELVLKRVAHRLAFTGFAKHCTEPRARETIARQLVAEGKIAIEIGFTEREVSISLHKATLNDLTTLRSQHPKMIIERALTTPDPLGAARRLQQRRRDHEKYLTGKLNGGDHGDIAPLIASKSFRLKVRPDDRYYQPRRLLKRFLNDKKWFESRLPEEHRSISRHLAARTFYLPAKHRFRLVREHARLDRVLDNDPRVERFKLKATLFQRSLGIAKDPVAHALKAVDRFETDYQAFREALPAQPRSVIRNLAMRSAFTSSLDHAEQVGASIGREPIPITVPELVARFQRFNDALGDYPSIGPYLALNMTLSSAPQKRLQQDMRTIRRGLRLEGTGVKREDLLEAIDLTLLSQPASHRAFIRKGLRGGFGDMQPHEVANFGEFRSAIHLALLKKGEQPEKRV